MWYKINGDCKILVANFAHLVRNYDDYKLSCKNLMISLSGAKLLMMTANLSYKKYLPQDERHSGLLKEGSDGSVALHITSPR